MASLETLNDGLLAVARSWSNMSGSLPGDEDLDEKIRAGCLQLWFTAVCCFCLTAFVIITCPIAKEAQANIANLQNMLSCSQAQPIPPMVPGT